MRELVPAALPQSFEESTELEEPVDLLGTAEPSFSIACWDRSWNG